MTDPNNMTPVESLQAAAETFLHVERISLEAQQTFAPNDAATFYLADALGSLAYGLKLIALSMAEGK